MPYYIEKAGDTYCVVKKMDGSRKGCHASKAEADAQVAALYANEPKAAFTLIDAARKAARREVHDGRPHIVVPVVALKEGVIHAMNSAADEFVPAAELSANGWHDKPIFIGHPLRNNAPVSAMTPGVMATAIGFTRNPAVADGQLTMEAWIDEAKAEQELVDTLLADLGMDVSIGAFVNCDNKPGEHRGKVYAGSWRNIMPDHLALLPGQRGACSWDMGCGVRACSQIRTEWADATGFDSHGRGIAEKASKRAEKASARAKDVTTHGEAQQAHEQAANEHENVVKELVGYGVPTQGSTAHGHLAKANEHRAKASMHLHTKNSYGRRNAEEGEMDHMYERWLEAGDETTELLKTLRNIPMSERDKLPADDFAGPNRSFPIAIAGDVHDAAASIGRAKGDSDPIKAKIIAIAYRKGAAFVDQLPDAWKKQKNASAFNRFMESFRELLGAEPELKAAGECGCHQKEKDTMTEQEMKAFVASATPEQLKALGIIKLPTDAEVKAAADEKALADKKTAADLKAAEDTKTLKAQSIKALKDTGKNVLTDAALEAMSQADLDKAIAAATAPKAATFEELLASAPAETRAAFAAAKSAATEKHTATVKVLVDAKRGGYTEAELKALSQEQLDKLVKLADIKAAATTVDFSGLGAPRADGNAGAVPAAPDMNARIKAAAAAKAKQ